MKAAQIGLGSYADGPDIGAQSRFLEILLKYGANPNEVQAAVKTRKKGEGFTALLFACENGNLDYVKILVNSGANVNYSNDYLYSALSAAVIVAHSPDVVLFLINKGADFKRPIFKTVDNVNQYVTDGLRYWRFELGSGDYKKKMQIVELLKKNGMDYRKTEIPKEFLTDHTKEYLDKY